MSALPGFGSVSYFRSMGEIVADFGIRIPDNTLYAIARQAPNKYMLVLKDKHVNITPTQAANLANSGRFTKQEMIESMKKNKTKSRGILESLLFEAESAIVPAETDPVELPKDISLDQKVDKYLVRYEREAIPTSGDYDVSVQDKVHQKTSGVTTGGGFAPTLESKRVSLKSLLFEAPGDPGEEELDPMADPAAAGAPPADPMAADPMAAGGMGADPMAAGGAPAPLPPATAPVIDTPKMNMNNYTRAVARLVNNYEALLNPRSTILNRAKEYIRVNYDEATAMMFEETMKTQYDMTAEAPQRDQEDAPHAGNAIYGGGAGG